MQPKLHLAYLVDSHGPGPVARAAAVMNSIHQRWPFVHFEIFSHSPERAFSPFLKPAFTYHGPLQKQETSRISGSENTARPSQGMAETISATGSCAVLSDVASPEIAALKQTGVVPAILEKLVPDWHQWEKSGPEQTAQSDQAAELVCRHLAGELEILEVVDTQGQVVGAAPRKQVHGNNDLLHRVVHVLVQDQEGRLLLQKRASHKRVAPGRWDTSVGGHVDCGETIQEAMYREMEEELGIRPHNLQFAYQYIHSNDFESELVYTYTCGYLGQVQYNPEEIEAVKPWDTKEIQHYLGTGVLSDNFEEEFQRYLQWLKLGHPSVI